MREQKYLHSTLSRDVMYCLNNVFGDTDREISKKTGLRKKLIAKIKGGDERLTLRQMKKIEKGYKVPSSIIYLKMVDHKGIPSGMEKAYQAIRSVFISSAEMSEEFGKIKYGNWRALIKN